MRITRHVPVAHAPLRVTETLRRLGNRKRHVRITITTDCSPEFLRSCWDGGSRDVYNGYDTHGQPMPLPVSGSAFEAQHGPWQPLPGQMLVRTGVFCGKPSTPHVTLYCTPDEFAYYDSAMLA